MSNKLDLSDEIASLGDNCVDIIYLNFCKAFDFISHDIMIKILVLYTFTEAHVKCIKKRVTDRSQKVVVNRESSLNGNIFNVTLQGSVSAPMLFIIFGSDLEVNIKLFLIKFVGGIKTDAVRTRAVGYNALGHLVNCPY